MSKRNNLKNRLKGGLLPMMGGATLNTDGTEFLMYKTTPSATATSITVSSLVNAALKANGMNGLKAVLGFSDNSGNVPTGGQTIDPSGNSGYLYLNGYTTVANPVAYNPAVGTQNGIPAWIIDQITAHAMNSTNTPAPIPLGSPVTIGGATFPNRLLTLQDLVGAINGSGALSLPNDVQAALESSPIAQFKHLPDKSHLN